AALGGARLPGAGKPPGSPQPPGDLRGRGDAQRSGSGDRRRADGGTALRTKRHGPNARVAPRRGPPGGAAGMSRTDAQEEVISDKAFPELRRIEATVGGMTCASCAVRVQRTLGRQSGVAAAGVNYATGQATVTYDPRVTDITTLTGPVDHSGYELTLVRPPEA